MKSGLYACATASATASAAACANRFDEPITNESKVYFGLRPLAMVSRTCTSFGATTGSSWSSTITSCTRRSWPVASPTAARIRPRKCPSIQSRVKSFGTARTNSSSLSWIPSTWSNHVRYVVSLRAPLSRLETSLHRLSAVSSIEGSTPPAGSFSRIGRASEHSSESATSQCPLFCCQRGQKVCNLQGIAIAPHRSPQVWTACRARRRLHQRRRLSCLGSSSACAPSGLWRTSSCDSVRLVYTGCSPPSDRAALPSSFSTRETDLSAQRAQAKAEARLPRADVDAGRPRDPQAQARQGPEAPLRVASRA